MVWLKMMPHRRHHHHHVIIIIVCVAHAVTAANNHGMDEGNGSGTGMEKMFFYWKISNVSSNKPL